MIANISKDFLSWNQQKEQINRIDRVIYFYEREIWWCSLGLNIGYEQDGKGAKFKRPVLIYKKFGSTFWGIPLSSTIKSGSYYFTFYFEAGIQNNVLLTQLKLFDSRRLIQKMGQMSQEDFLLCNKKLLALCQ